MGDELLWAVRNGDLDYLNSKSFDANADFNGSPLLVAAADYGQVDVIKLLIKNGASVNQPSRHGITPILAAIYENHVDSVKVLLQHGASKEGKCPDGSSYVEATSSEEMKSLLK